MQIVIEMTEDDYKKVQDGRAAVTVMRNAIRNGIPLPKGHGRLIDADALEQRLEYDMRDADKRCDFYRVDRINTAENYVADTETIIEADKEGAEE